MPTDFIAKFTVSGGPAPLAVLDSILVQAAENPAREAWFGTHKSGAGWDGAGTCILLAVPSLDAIIADIVGRSSDPPTAAASSRGMDLYSDLTSFVKWWKLRNPIRIRFSSLAGIPGRAWYSGKSAPDVFRSQVSFAYWDFRGVSLGHLPSEARAPIAAPRSPSPLVVAMPADPASSPTYGGEPWRQPDVPLHGVDFSGGQENERCGNSKIWVASWVPGCTVELRSGFSSDAATKICREDLPALIAREPGWWSLDFPFGIAKETGTALGLSSWQEWLKWCTREGTATDLRNSAQALTRRAGLSWARRRYIDTANRTTWFPLFEQLYRQTIYGAREVLWSLQGTDICILPWNCHAMHRLTKVVEGFPGATIRDHVFRHHVPYKGAGTPRREARHAIVQALRSTPFSIPISDRVAAQAVADNEGDAVDALALLLGAWISQRLPADTWKLRMNDLESSGAEIEGWFPI
jgi:hypothetical protein